MRCNMPPTLKSFEQEDKSHSQNQQPSACPETHCMSSTQGLGEREQQWHLRGFICGNPPATHLWMCPKLGLTIHTAKCPHRMLYLIIPLWRNPRVRAPRYPIKSTTHLFHNHHLNRTSWDTSTMLITTGSKDNMTWKDRFPPFSSKEAQAEDPTTQWIESSLFFQNTQGTPSWQVSDCTLGPLYKADLEIPEELGYKRPVLSCCCLPIQKGAWLANNIILAVS